jgi:hypothetical protein
MEIGAVLPASLTCVAVAGAAVAAIAAIARTFEAMFDLDLG